MTRRRFGVPIWGKLPFLAVLIPGTGGRGDVARRWVKARRAEPELLADLIRMGGLLATQPFDVADGIPEVASIDPLRLAYEKGWRDLALHLSALMALNTHELNSLMESNNVSDLDD